MTTNNLIGYDPLAWMEGEVVEEIPAEPAKKIAKSKAKIKIEPVEVDEPVSDSDTIEEETPEELPVVLEKTEENDDVEVDVSIDENGEIEISVETPEKTEVSIEIAVENNEPDDNDVLDALVEEASEISEEESAPEVIESMPEEIIEPLIELRAEANLKTIAELYETCKRVMTAHDVIEINAADVTTIDTATFQLLVSLKKDAPLLNKTINIVYPSARFVESAKLLDLLTVLEIDN